MDLEKHKQATKLMERIDRLRKLETRLNDIFLGHDSNSVIRLIYGIDKEEDDLLLMMNNICKYRITEEIKTVREQFEEL